MLLEPGYYEHLQRESYMSFLPLQGLEKPVLVKALVESTDKICVSVSHTTRLKDRAK